MKKETFVAVADASLVLREGENLGIVGESGSGKTTLGRCIQGVHRPTGGRVLYTDGAGATTDLLGLLVEHVAEEERELFPAMATFVSVADYEAALTRIRRRAGARRLAWLLPWVAQHATSVEVERSLAGAGRGTRLLLALSTPRFARHRRAALR